MAKVRKRTWTNSKGEQTAWIADYFDQAGKRHIKTFERERDARAWLTETLVSVKQGTHTPESASITVAEAANLWIEKCEAGAPRTFDAAPIPRSRPAAHRPAYNASRSISEGGCRRTPTAPERCCVRVMRW